LRKKLLITAGSLAMFAIAAGVVLITLGLYRYGGVEGLTDRARLQFAAEQPHEDFVPTPESAAEVDAAELAGAAAAALGTDPAPTTSTADAAALPTVRTLSTEQALTKLASLMQPPNAGLPAGARAASAPSQTATATRKPRPTATSQPAASQTPAPSASTAATDAVSAAAFPPAMQLQGMAHYWQTWNNCGPATLSMNLSYFGVKIGQEKIGPLLKPEKDDKNVGPEQLAEFAQTQGLKSLVRVNGDANRLKALLRAGIPVLVETWYEPKPNDGMGHYKLIVGYDDAASDGGHWIAYDSYDSHGLKKGDPYNGVTFAYAEFDQLWKVFGRTYIPVYDDQRAKAVEAVLAADMDDGQMWQRALAADMAYVKANPKDAFGWFNLGTAYVNTGDFQAAAQAYDTARRLKLPWRMLWYQFGPFKAYYEVGRYQEVIDLADATIKTAVNDEELFYWKGLAQQALGDPVSAKASLEQAIKLRSTYQDAVDALAKLQ
jgi:tetratricopeptide (TPR) repeat protein